MLSQNNKVFLHRETLEEYFKSLFEHYPSVEVQNPQQFGHENGLQ